MEKETATTTKSALDQRSVGNETPGKVLLLDYALETMVTRPTLRKPQIFVTMRLLTQWVLVAWCARFYLAYARATQAQAVPETFIANTKIRFHTVSAQFRLVRRQRQVSNFVKPQLASVCP